MAEVSRQANEEVAGSSLWRDAWRRLLKNRAAVAGLVLVLSMAAIAALFEPISRHVTHFSHTENHVCLRYQPPGMRGVPREHHALVGQGGAAQIGELDRDGNASLDATELSAALSAIEFDYRDSNGDGGIDLREFEDVDRSFLQDRAELFAGLDSDGNAALSAEESASFTRIWPVSEAGVFVRHHDVDGDGVLGADEFSGLPRPQVFWMGTDSLGRDIATRMVYGARISLAVGLLATLVSFFIGITWGAVAGFYGGRVDAVMMRIVDIIYGLPFMFLVILLLVIFGRNIMLLFVAIGAVSWLTMSRIVRGQVISLKNQEFVLAARSVGTSNLAIVFRHLIPNAMGPIIVYATLTVPAVMLEEAFLSFLGLGVQAPDTSWGALANDGASLGVMLNYTWLIAFPGLALAITLLSLNFIGDGLRDALDPRMRKD